MGPNIIDELLRGAVFVHLTEEELDDLIAKKLEGVHLERVREHLKGCLICKKRLDFLRRERLSVVYRLPPEEIDRIMENIRSVPTEPIGVHLDEDDFIAYSFDSFRERLEPQEIERIDEHLTSCPACAKEMERMLEGTEYWNTEAGQKHLEEYRREGLKTALKIISENG